MWEEFQELKTEEAKLLKQLDKLEVVIQAFEYEGTVTPEKLDEFWHNACRYIKEPQLVLILKELSRLRKAI